MGAVHFRHHWRSSAGVAFLFWQADRQIWEASEHTQSLQQEWLSPLWLPSCSMLWFLPRCPPKATCTPMWGFWELLLGSQELDTHHWICSLINLQLNVTLGVELGWKRWVIGYGLQGFISLSNSSHDPSLLPAHHALSFFSARPLCHTVLSWRSPTVDWNLYKLCTKTYSSFHLWVLGSVSQQWESKQDMWAPQSPPPIFSSVIIPVRKRSHGVFLLLLGNFSLDIVYLLFINFTCTGSSMYSHCTQQLLEHGWYPLNISDLKGEQVVWCLHRHLHTLLVSGSFWERCALSTGRQESEGGPGLSFETRKLPGFWVSLWPENNSVCPVWLPALVGKSENNQSVPKVLRKVSITSALCALEGAGGVSASNYKGNL